MTIFTFSWTIPILHNKNAAAAPEKSLESVVNLLHLNEPPAPLEE